MTLNRRSLLTSTGAIALAGLLPACGGGDDSGGARLRLVNASTGYDSLDLYVDGQRHGAGVPFGSAGAYGGFGTDALVTALARTGSTAYLVSDRRSLPKNTDSTLLAYGWEGGLKVIQLRDDEAAAGGSQAKLRVLNLAPDAGPLDVFLTGETDSLTGATPTVPSAPSGEGSAYVVLQGGSYRVRVTGAGTPGDLRLDVSAVSLGTGQVLNLILVSGASGVLVRGLLMPQGQAPAVLGASRARLRVVNALDGQASVNATVDQTVLMAGSRAPTIGAYTTVAAGTRSVVLAVEGTPVTVAPFTAAEGTDHTLLVHGPASAPQVRVLTDDNRLPASSSDYKIRLVHAAQSLAAGRLTMTVNFAALASDVAFGHASGFIASAATAAGQLEVTSPLVAGPVYALKDVALSAKGVYTVYLMMAGSVPIGVLRKER